MVSTPQVVTTLISLVSYITKNEEASISELASVFELSEETVRDYLNLLWVSGMPGDYGPKIDVFEADGFVSLDNTEGVDTPVRLSALEAHLLLMALEVSETDTPEIAQSVVRKLRSVIDEAESQALSLEPAEVPASLRAAVRHARETETALRIEYYVRSRDEVTTRTVSPVDLTLDGQWYLDAYCHVKQGYRSFRVDNIRTWETTSEPAQYGQREHDTGQTCTITFSPEGAWLADELTPRQVTFDTHGPGTVTVELTVYSADWMVQLLMMHGRHVLAVEPGEYARLALERLEWCGSN